MALPTPKDANPAVNRTRSRAEASSHSRVISPMKPPAMLALSGLEGNWYPALWVVAPSGKRVRLGSENHMKALSSLDVERHLVKEKPSALIASEERANQAIFR